MGSQRAAAIPTAKPMPMAIRYFRNPVKGRGPMPTDGRLWLYVSDPSDQSCAHGNGFS